MTSTPEDALLHFDLDFLHPTSNNIPVPAVKQKYITQLKKRIIRVDALQNHRNAINLELNNKNKELEEIRRKLESTSQEYTQTSIDYKEALENCAKCENENQRLKVTIKKFEEESYRAVNELRATQSHVVQLEQLVKQQERKIDSVDRVNSGKSEKAIEEKYISKYKEKDKEILVWKKKYDTLSKQFEELKCSYEKSIKAKEEKHASELTNELLNSPDHSDMEDDVSDGFISPTQDASLKFKPIKNMNQKCAHQDTPESNNEVMSVDLGYGSSLASSDNEKWLNSPDYVFSPVNGENNNHLRERKLVSTGTSPIPNSKSFKETGTSPIPNSKSFKETGTSPVKSLIVVNSSTSPHIVKINTPKADNHIDTISFNDKDVKLGDSKSNSSNLQQLTKTSRNIATQTVIQDNSLERTDCMIQENNKDVMEIAPDINKNEDFESKGSEVNEDKIANKEIEMILDSMRLNYKPLSPIPRRPAKVAVQPVGIQSHNNGSTEDVKHSQCPEAAIARLHADAAREEVAIARQDAAKAREDNKKLMSTLENLMRDMFNIKSFLRNQMLVPEEVLYPNYNNISEKDMLNINKTIKPPEPCRPIISDDLQEPSYDSTSNVSIDVPERVQENKITVLSVEVIKPKDNLENQKSVENSVIDCTKDLNLNDVPKRVQENKITVLSVEVIKPKDNLENKKSDENSVIDCTKDLRLEDSIEEDEEDTDIISLNCNNIIEFEDCETIEVAMNSPIEDVKSQKSKRRRRIKKLTNLAKYRRKCEVRKCKIRARTPPLVKPHTKPKQIRKIMPKKITAHDSSLTLNDKQVYAKAVKIMAELNAKVNTKISATEKSNQITECKTKQLETPVQNMTCTETHSETSSEFEHNNLNKTRISCVVSPINNITDLQYFVTYPAGTIKSPESLKISQELPLSNDFISSPRNNDIIPKKIFNKPLELSKNLQKCMENPVCLFDTEEISKKPLELNKNSQNSMENSVSLIDTEKLDLTKNLQKCMENPSSLSDTEIIAKTPLELNKNSQKSMENPARLIDNEKLDLTKNLQKCMENHVSLSETEKIAKIPLELNKNSRNSIENPVSLLDTERISNKPLELTVKLERCMEIPLRLSDTEKIAKKPLESTKNFQQENTVSTLPQVDISYAKDTKPGRTEKSPKKLMPPVMNSSKTAEITTTQKEISINNMNKSSETSVSTCPLSSIKSNTSKTSLETPIATKKQFTTPLSPNTFQPANRSPMSTITTRSRSRYHSEKSDQCNEVVANDSKLTTKTNNTPVAQNSNNDKSVSQAKRKRTHSNSTDTQCKRVLRSAQCTKAVTNTNILDEIMKTANDVSDDSVQEDSWHPKESIMCAMVQKYGVKKVRVVGKNTPDAVLNDIRGVIEKYVKAIKETSNNKDILLNELLGELQKHHYKNLVSGLIHYLSQPERKLELFAKSLCPPAPPMTKSEEILLYVLKELRDCWEPVDIIDTLLSAIEHTLFKLNRTPDFGTIESVSHFYALLCRYFGAKSRLIVFMLDAMYCILFKSVPLIKQCLEVWPHVIPLAHMSIAKTPLVTCFVYLLHFYKCEDRFNRVQDIRNILNRKYFYEATEWNEKKILELFNNAIKDLKAFNTPNEKKMLRIALIILGKRHGPRWTQNNIIKKILLPLIEDESVPENIKEFCISMIGPLVKPYPVDMKVHCEIAINQLIDILKETNSTRIEDAVLTSLVMMSRHNNNRVSEILLTQKMRPLSRDLEDILRNYIRIKPLHVWIKSMTYLNLSNN